MSDSEEEDNFVFYGTALEPLDEADITKKKRISVADQIVVDENGRRRFHGAFTGGFSAGYFNSVGSKEGWAPSTFKSTRKDRSSVKTQNVQDFMDDEDVGAFGIAPQMLRPTDDYSSGNKQSKKRPKPVQSDGPIPGLPVLERIVEPVISSIGVRLLQKLGWRPGQGIGPRISKSEKKKHQHRKQKKKTEIVVSLDDKHSEIEKTSDERTYGCMLPPEMAQDNEGSSSDDSYEDIERNVLFAPDDYDAPFYVPKVDTFGIGYKGLDRNTILSSGNFDLFGSKLKFRVDNKNMNITGEAFGVGAFEEADADIYSHEDLSQYDFALETPQERKERKGKELQDKVNKKNQNNSRSSDIEGFLKAKSAPIKPKYYPAPDLPADFQAFHISRKSRFEKGTDQKEVEDDGTTNKKRVPRHGLTIAERQVLIGEHSGTTNDKTSEKYCAGASTSADVDKVSTTISSRSSSIISNQKSNDARKESTSSSSTTTAARDSSVLERVERLKKFTQVLQAYSSSKPDNEATGAAFKPFMKNPDKQDRYEKFLTLVAAGFQECLKDLQPAEMTDWEREREKLEFQRAAALYKPVSGVMSSRFVSAKSHDISHIVPEREVLKEKDPTQDPTVAAKMNLFGKLTHKVVEWHPDKILSKRFNVPPPYPDSNIVGLRTGTSVNAEPTQLVELVKPAPVAKKSLFEDLDFSKPPPGLFPAASFTALEKPLEASASCKKSGESPGMRSEGELEPMETDSTELISSVKPPMDLFKEIFADTSSDSSEDEPESNSQASPSMVSASSTATKHPPSKGIHERVESENRDKGAYSKMRHDDEVPSRKVPSNKNLTTTTSGNKGKSDERSESHDSHKDQVSNTRIVARNKAEDYFTQSPPHKKGIFDNLDFSKMMSAGQKEQYGGKETDINKSKSSRIVGAGDSSELLEGDELLYGPLPPMRPSSSSAPAKSSFVVPTSSKSLSGLSLNYSYNQNKWMKERVVDQVDDQVVWVEKDSMKSDSGSRSKKKHKKKSKSSRSSSSSLSKSKKSKVKHKSKEKHKSKKDHKHKSKPKKSNKDKHRGRAESSSDDKSGNESATSSSSSVEIHDSLDNRALLNKLKEITRSH